MKIKIKYHDDQCKINQFGDWIDCKSSENVEGKKGEHKLISLGFSIKLPPYYELIIAPRSSSFSKYGITMPNSPGVVDSMYCGNGDIVMMSALFTRKGDIRRGDRICQMRIQLTQDATWLQKLKWLFDSKIEFEEVEDLESVNRGGFGSTGVR